MQKRSDHLEILTSWQELKEKYEGKELIMIAMSHNRPSLDIIFGTSGEITEKGIGMKNSISLNAVASRFISYKPNEPWCGEWYPWDGYAKILTLIDPSTKEIVYTKAWDKFMIAAIFGEGLFEDLKTDKGITPLYGKPWEEILKVFYGEDKEVIV